MSKKVAVALSGGVDSAVVAKLLLDQGYDVVGITAKMACDENFDLVVNNASNVAQNLGISHYVLDLSNEFKKCVIDYFVDAYKEGQTPNPCIVCNRDIKWGSLFDYAINVLKCDYVATGHYANIIFDKVYKLYPASDEHKDQLYFLFLLTQDRLSKTLFPLSCYKKEDVRKIAINADLPPKSSKESQDICFIKPPMTTKKFLNANLPQEEGFFVEKSTGKVLGKHNGYWQYTIGQRKGIGIAAPQPLYVVDIDSKTNTVFVGLNEDLFSKELILENVVWSYDIPDGEFEVMVKIRYNMKAVSAKVKKEGRKAFVNFMNPVSAITNGQACVLYDIQDGHLLGGAFI